MYTRNIICTTEFIFVPFIGLQLIIKGVEKHQAWNKSRCFIKNISFLIMSKLTECTSHNFSWEEDSRSVGLLWNQKDRSSFQENTQNGPHSQLAESSQYPHYILIWHASSYSENNFVHTRHISYVCYMAYPFHLPDLTNPIIFNKDNKLQSSSLYSPGQQILS